MFDKTQTTIQAPPKQSGKRAVPKGPVAPSNKNHFDSEMALKNAELLNLRYQNEVLLAKLDKLERQVNQDSNFKAVQPLPSPKDLSLTYNNKSTYMNVLQRKIGEYQEVVETRDLQGLHRNVTQTRQEIEVLRMNYRELKVKYDQLKEKFLLLNKNRKVYEAVLSQATEMRDILQIYHETRFIDNARVARIDFDYLKEVIQGRDTSRPDQPAQAGKEPPIPNLITESVRKLVTEEQVKTHFANKISPTGDAVGKNMPAGEIKGLQRVPTVQNAAQEDLISQKSKVSGAMVQSQLQSESFDSDREVPVTPVGEKGGAKGDKKSNRTSPGKTKKPAPGAPEKKEAATETVAGEGSARFLPPAGPTQSRLFEKDTLMKQVVKLQEMSERIQVLEQELARKADLMEAMEAQISTLNAAARAKDSEGVNEVEEVRQELQKKIDEIKERFGKQIKELTADHTEEAEKLKAALSALESAKREESQRLTEQLLEARKRMSEAVSRNDDLDIKLNEVVSEKESLEAKIKKYTEKIAKMAEEQKISMSRLLSSEIRSSGISPDLIRSISEGKKAASPTDIHVSREDFDKIQTELRNFGEMSGKFEQMAEARMLMAKKVEEAEAEAKLAQAEKENVEVELRNQVTLLALRENEKRKLLEQIEQLKAAAEEDVGRRKELEAEKFLNLQRIESLENQAADFRNRDKAMEIERQTMRYDLEDKDEEVRRALEAKAKAQKESQDLLVRVDSLEAQLRKKEDEFVGLEAMLLVIKKEQEQAVEIRAMERTEQLDLQNSKLVGQMVEKDTQLERLTSEVDLLNREIDNLQEMLASRKEKILTQVKSSLKPTDLVSESARQQIDLLNEILAMKEREVEAISSKIGANVAMAEQMKAENEEVRSQRSEMLQQLTHLRAEVDRLSRLEVVFANIDQSEDGTRRAFLQLAEATELLEKKEMELRHTLSENQRLQGELSQKIVELGLAEETVTRLTKEIEEKAAALYERDESLRKAGGAQAELVKQAEEMRILEAQNQYLKSALEEFATKLPDAEKRLKAEQVELRLLEGELARAERVKVEARNRIKTLEDSLQAAAARLEEVTAEKDKRIALLESRIADMRKLSTQFGQVEKLFEEKDLQIFEMAQVSNQRKDEIAKLRAENVLLAAQNSELTSKATEMETKATSLLQTKETTEEISNTNLGAYRRKYKIPESHHGNVKEVVTLYQVLEQAKARVEELSSFSESQKKLGELSNRVGELEGELREATAKITTLKEALASQEYTSTAAVRKAEQLEKNNQDLLSKFEIQKEEIAQTLGKLRVEQFAAAEKGEEIFSLKEEVAGLKRMLDLKDSAYRNLQEIYEQQGLGDVAVDSKLKVYIGKFEELQAEFARSQEEIEKQKIEALRKEAQFLQREEVLVGQLQAEKEKADSAVELCTVAEDTAAILTQQNTDLTKKLENLQAELEEMSKQHATALKKHNVLMKISEFNIKDLPALGEVALLKARVEELEGEVSHLKSFDTVRAIAIHAQNKQLAEELANLTNTLEVERIAAATSLKSAQWALEAQIEELQGHLDDRKTELAGKEGELGHCRLELQVLKGLLAEKEADATGKSQESQQLQALLVQMREAQVASDAQKSKLTEKIRKLEQARKASYQSLYKLLPKLGRMEISVNRAITSLQSNVISKLQRATWGPKQGSTLGRSLEGKSELQETSQMLWGLWEPTMKSEIRRLAESELQKSILAKQAKAAPVLAQAPIVQSNLSTHQNEKEEAIPEVLEESAVTARSDGQETAQFPSTRSKNPIVNDMASAFFKKGLESEYERLKKELETRQLSSQVVSQLRTESRQPGELERSLQRSGITGERNWRSGLGDLQLDAEKRSEKMASSSLQTSKSGVSRGEFNTTAMHEAVANSYLKKIGDEGSGKIVPASEKEEARVYSFSESQDLLADAVREDYLRRLMEEMKTKSVFQTNQSLPGSQTPSHLSLRDQYLTRLLQENMNASAFKTRVDPPPGQSEAIEIKMNESQKSHALEARNGNGTAPADQPMSFRASLPKESGATLTQTTLEANERLRQEYVQGILAQASALRSQTPQPSHLAVSEIPRESIDRIPRESVQERLAYQAALISRLPADASLSLTESQKATNEKIRAEYIDQLIGQAPSFKGSVSAKASESMTESQKSAAERIRREYVEGLIGQTSLLKSRVAQDSLPEALESSKAPQDRTRSDIADQIFGTSPSFKANVAPLETLNLAQSQKSVGRGAARESVDEVLAQIQQGPERDFLISRKPEAISALSQKPVLETSLLGQNKGRSIAPIGDAYLDRLLQQNLQTSGFRSQKVSAVPSGHQSGVTVQASQLGNQLIEQVLQNLQESTLASTSHPSLPKSTLRESKPEGQSAVSVKRSEPTPPSRLPSSQGQSQSSSVSDSRLAQNVRDKYVDSVLKAIPDQSTVVRASATPEFSQLKSNDRLRDEKLQQLMVEHTKDANLLSAPDQSLPPVSTVRQELMDRVMQDYFADPSNVSVNPDDFLTTSQVQHQAFKKRK